MAGENPIKASDLYKDDGAILEAIKQLSEMRSAYVSTLESINKEARELINVLKNVNNTTEEGRNTTRGAATDAERLAAAQKRYKTELSDVDDQIADLKLAHQQLSREQKLQIKLANSQEGSYNRLSAQYALNKLRLNAMSTEERKNTAAGRELEAQTKKLYQEMDRLQRATGKATLGVGWYERASMSLRNTLTSLTATYIGLSAAQRGADAVYNKTKELDSLDNSLRAVITDQGEYADTLTLLSTLADGYGVDVLRLTKSYVGFYAAAKETNIPLSQQQAIFSSIIKSSAVLGRTTEETEGALLAVTQMMSKGNVQAEELRGQLGERLPGAFNIMAKSMGITVAELNDLLKQGQVLASDVLPKFAQELEKSFGADQIDRVDTLAASEGRLANETTELVKAFNASDVLTDFNNALATGVKFVKDNLSAIINLGKAVVLLATTYATWRATQWLSTKAMAAWTITTQGATVATKLKEAATYQAMLAEEAFSKALKKNPIGLIVTVIAAAATAYLLFAKRVNEAEQAQKNIADVQKEAIKNTVREKTELNNLLAVARNEKLTKEERLKAIRDINNISPEMLGNIKLETINTKEAAEMIDVYIEALNRKALAQAINSKQQELQNELIEKEFKNIQDYKSGIESASDKIYESIWRAFGVDVSGQIIKNREELDEYIKSLGLTGKNAQTMRDMYEPLIRKKEEDIQATKNQIEALDAYYKKQIENGSLTTPGGGQDNRGRTIEIIEAEIEAERKKIQFLTAGTKEEGALIDKRIAALEKERDAIYNKNREKAKKVKEPDYWKEHEEQISLLEEGQNKELGVLQIAYWKKIQLFEKLGLDTNDVTEWYERERLKIIERYQNEEAAEWEKQKKAREQAAKEEYDKMVSNQDEIRDLRLSEIDIMNVTEAEKNRLRLKAEKERLEAILKMNEEYGQMISDNEIEILKNTITKIDQELAKNEDKKLDLYDLLGINLDDKQKEALNESVNFALQQLQSYMDKRVELADRAVDAAQRETQASQDRLNAEIEARNNGYANSVLTAQRELELKKREEAAALREKEKALKAQQRLDTVMQTSSLITATANIWKSLSTIPYIGPALALAAIGTMWGSFAAAKVKANQVTKEKYGEGGFEFLSGGSHASGDDIPIGMTDSGKQRTAEGGETLAIIKKKSTAKYRKIIPDIINSLNKGTFEKKFQNTFLPAEKLPSIAFTTNFDSPELKKIGEDLSAIRKSGDKKYYTDENGNTVEIYRNIKRIIKT